MALKPGGFSWRQAFAKLLPSFLLRTPLLKKYINRPNLCKLNVTIRPFQLQLFMSVGRWWILTIPHHNFTPFQHSDVQFIRGQLEQGAAGYLHWQVVICLSSNARLSRIKKLYGDTAHAELTRSPLALEYVFKSDTRVQGTQFELGTRPFNRASKRDWDQVRSYYSLIEQLIKHFS